MANNITIFYPYGKLCTERRHERRHERRQRRVCMVGCAEYGGGVVIRDVRHARTRIAFMAGILRTCARVCARVASVCCSMCDGMHVYSVQHACDVDRVENASTVGSLPTDGRKTGGADTVGRHGRRLAKPTPSSACIRIAAHICMQITRAERMQDGRADV